MVNTICENFLLRNFLFVGYSYQTTDFKIRKKLFSDRLNDYPLFVYCLLNKNVCSMPVRMTA